MKAGFVFTILLWLGYLAQTTVLPYGMQLLSNHLGLGFLGGQTIELSFIILAYLAIHRDFWSALSWSIWIGLMARWFALSWPGCLAIAYFLTTVGCVGSRKNLLIQSGGSIVIFVFVLSLVKGFIQLQALSWIYSVPDAFWAHGSIWLIQAFLNALVAPYLFKFLHEVDEYLGITGFLGSRRNLIGL